jgi:hypothetical protein
MMHGLVKIKEEYVILKKGNTADISFTAMLKKTLFFRLGTRILHLNVFINEFTLAFMQELSTCCHNI